jgi:hypothetical protein
VGTADSVGERDSDLQQPTQREPALEHELRQGPSVDELHRDEVHRARRGVCFVYGMQRHDVGMVQGRDRPRFALEACPTLRIGRHRLGKNLQRDVAVELRVLGLPHDTHAALADLLDQAVVQQLLAGFDGHFTALRS